MSCVVDELADLGIVVRSDRSAEQRVPCPQCGKGGRDDALGVNLETGVFHCFRCNWSGRAGDRRSASARVAHPSERSLPSSSHVDPAKLVAIWARTQPMRGTLGETYLVHRHCAMPPVDSDVRYLPGTDRHPPSLCSLVTDAVTGEAISLHFTRLRADGVGKAGTDRDKLLLKGHRKAGGVIRVWPNETVTLALGIAEGIETALSAAHAFTPVWATVDAGNMAKLPVLNGIETLVIFADNDSAGLSAARTCGNRWAAAGRVVRLVVPEHGDFNDAVAA